jgi:hypothetical protein
LLSLPAFNTLGSDAPFIVAVVLVVILEACLASGFIGAVKFDQFNSKRKQENSALEKENSKPATSLNQQTVNGIQTNGATALISTRSKDAAGFADEQGLRKDEQSIMELFLYRQGY